MKNQDPNQEHLQSIISLFNQGQLQQALSESSQLLERFPNSVILYNIAGACNAGLMQFDAAINNYKKALKINPYYADAYSNMGNVLKDKGDLEAAIESYKQALKIKPDYAQAYNNMGNALKDKGDLEAAIQSYKQALKIKPDYAQAYSNMGIALKGKGDLNAAISSYKQALKIKPDYAEAYNNMGSALNDKGDLEAAIESYKQALKIKPDYSEAYNNMGIALKDKGDLEAAIESYKQALKIKSDYAEAYRNLSTMHRYKEHDEYFLKMQSLCQSSSILDEQRCHLNFALSKASEDLNEVSQSFNYLKIGNELRKKILSYDIKKDIELFSQLKKSYPSIALQSVVESSDLKPIFILGMPRSGTTLVEQIVSSHSEVTGAGELSYVSKFGGPTARGAIKPNTKMILDFRQRYIEALKKRSDGRSIVTDKMPQNFLYVGLIFAAFPDAKVIHVNRDPAATCWSNYKHYFIDKELGYCYDLDDTVTYFGLYTDLMQFWLGHYGDRIYNLNYDNLTINQDDETRKLIEYLELEWENDCLSPQHNKRSVRTVSQQQVRQKVYQGSSQQWRKFEPYLNGAFDQLSELN
ncbi:tetratricopeptide repeat protein [Candidatus Thioglobus sp.]|nr:tetratricopeptide repeat protein [Candidatus Thioglobus sp.]